MKKKYVTVVGVVFLLIFVIGVLPTLSIFHGEMDIDLLSGKCRSRYYVWKVKIIDQVEDTKLSKLVSTTSQTETTPLWKLETKWSDFPLRYSQGGRFKSSCDNFICHLEVGEELGRIDKDCKIALIQDFLNSMKAEDVQRMEEICEEIAVLYQEAEYPQQTEPNKCNKIEKEGIKYSKVSESLEDLRKLCNIPEYVDSAKWQTFSEGNDWGILIFLKVKEEDAPSINEKLKVKAGSRIMLGFDAIPEWLDNTEIFSKTILSGTYEVNQTIYEPQDFEKSPLLNGFVLRPQKEALIVGLHTL